MKTEGLQVNWKWFVVFGSASIALAALAFSLPGVFQISLDILIGLILVANGVFQAVETFKGHENKEFFMSIGTAVLQIGVGGWMLINPNTSTDMLGWIVGIIFVCEGIFKLYWANGIRPDATWQWLAINGVVAIIMGGLIGFQIFGSERWIISYMIGGNLFLGGLTLVLVGLMNRMPGLVGGGSVPFPLPGAKQEENQAGEAQETSSEKTEIEKPPVAWGKKETDTAQPENKGESPK